MKPKFDILGLGAVAVDELIYVETYPRADVKTRVLRTERHCGGLTAAALIAASRLGSKCAYAGVLGDDELSRFAIQQMQDEGIELKHLEKNREARPGHSFIVIDSATGTRNVFSESSPAINASRLADEIVRSARVLVVDHKDVNRMVSAATIARQAGIPVVADFEREAGPKFPKLLALVDHLILSQSFAEKLTGKKNPGLMARALWTPSRRVVAITCGEEGCCYFEGDKNKVRHQPAFKVKTVDTNGCGDVFHGAYASALARGKTVPECICFASAAAALKAAKPGGPAGMPIHSAIARFLRTQQHVRGAKLAPHSNCLEPFGG